MVGRLDDPDAPAPYLTNAGLALAQRSRWEKAFHAELTNAYADEPTVLVAALLPPRLVARAEGVLATLTSSLPRWASEFIRRRQFADDPDSLAPSAVASAQDIADALAPTLATAAFSQHVLSLLAARGIEYKQWVTRHDDRVRHTHRKADGQMVRLSAPFIVGGALMQHPADSNTAPIGEWINDRCAIIGRPEEGSTR